MSGPAFVIGDEILGVEEIKQRLQPRMSLAQRLGLRRAPAPAPSGMSALINDIQALALRVSQYAQQGGITQNYAASLQAQIAQLVAEATILAQGHGG